MADGGDWVLIGLDEKMARRQGMPPRLPVPRAEFEGLADQGLGVAKARTWIKDFLTNSEPGKSGTWRKQNALVVSSLEAFLDKAPLWDKAQKAFAAGEWDKALSSLKRITGMDADDHAAKLNLASAQANLGDHAAALKGFKAIAKTFEGDADYHVAYGHVHLALGDRDAALDQMVLALEAKPDCQPALDAMEKLGVLVAVYENPRDAASLTYVRADSVLAYLTEQWKAEPRDAAFYLEQLAYHERERRHAVALAAAEAALAAFRDAGSDAAPDAAGRERAAAARIAALRALGRADEALAAARAFAEHSPQSAAARVELSRCLAAAGKAEEAAAEVEAALAVEPGDQAALVARYWPEDATDIERVNEALPALRAFAEAHPSVAGVWRSVARAELIIGRHDEALVDFARASELAPDDDDLRAEYWAELGKQQRYQDILTDAARVADIGKRDWKLRWNEAEAYAGLGKKVEARAAFSAINFDQTLHVDVRKRAKRAVKSLDEGTGGEGASPT